MSDPVRLIPEPASAVAVVGMAGRFPGAADVDAFWANLRSGVEGIRRFSREELVEAGVDEASLDHPAYVRAAAPVDDVEMFDARFFGFSPRDAEITDPQQRLLLECAWEAFESAGHEPGTVDGPVGVFAGASLSSYLLNLYSRPDVVSAVGEGRVLQGNDKDFVATWISYKLDLRGPSVTVQTACSTSLTAVHLAVGSLLAGECDLALAGGSSLVARQRTGYIHREGDILSPDGHCRAFDADAAGTVGGNGVGVVLLRRIEDALRDGDPIRAVLLGSAVNNDGADKVGYTAPSVEGQARVIAEALAVAGVEPAEIGYVEAHGTGTTLGDPVEVAALNEVFAAGGEDSGTPVLLGSVKSSIGHLDAAAGVAGLIKTVLALEHGEVPPSLHFRRPNPRIDFAAGPLRVAAELEGWPGAPDRPRRAGVSSFGIGGTNVHVVVQEPPPRDAGDPPSRPLHPLLVSARSPSALAAARAALADRLEALDDGCLPDVAFTLQTGRRGFEHRWAGVGTDRRQAAELLRAAGGVTARAEEGRAVHFLFPGQGSHHPGMGRQLYAAEPVFREALDRCVDLLAAAGDTDLHRLLLSADDEAGAEAALADTAGAQPALFALSWALAELWQSWGVEPRGMLGHSLGEYVAACRAGVFELGAALRLVAARGRLMATLPAGSMLGVGLAEEEVGGWLEGRSELALAAVNGPRSAVVSGPTEAVERLAGELEEAGVAARPLHTSHAFHSPMMDPVLDEFGKLVEAASPAPPSRRYVSNLSGGWVDPEEVATPGHWVRHLRHTVRFGDGLATLLEEGGVLLEVGPGNALTTLARGSGATAVHSLPHPRDETPQHRVLLTALGRLWTTGVPVSWDDFHAGERRRRRVLPTYPFERRRYWVEAGRVSAGESGAPRRRPVERWLYLPSWRRGEPPRRPAAGDLEPGRRWLVLSDGELGRRLVDGLRAAAQEVEVVRPPGAAGGEGHPAPAAERGAYARLLSELDDPRRPFHRIVHLWSVPRRVAWSDGARTGGAVLEEGFSSLAALFGALGEGSDEERDVRVVSSQLAPVLGDEEVCPLKATLIGPCLVAPQEYPHLRVGLVEVPPPEEGPAAWEDGLLGELARPPAAPRVALRGAARWLPTVVETTAPAAAAPGVGGDGFHLISGGTGLVGLALAEQLAREGREAGGARLLLVSRSGRLDDDRRDRLTALGAEVEVRAADVAEPGALESAVAAAEARFGALRGVVHAAGVVGPGSLRSLGEIEGPDVERIFRAKVEGTRRLRELLADRSPDYVFLTGSLSAVLGGLGHAAYSAANCFLAAAAEHLRGAWMTADWDGWSPGDGEGDDGAVTPRRGGRVFGELRGLAGAVPRALVSTTDLDARLRRWVEEPGGEPEGDREETAPAPTQAQHPRPDLEAAYVAPATPLEERLALLWGELLGVERVGSEDDFFELGGQSLLATRLFARLRQTFGVALPLRTIFERPTVRRLAEAVGERLEPEAEDVIPRQPRDGALPLSYAQQRLWFLDRLNPGDTAYLIRSPFRLRGPLSVPALRQAAAEIVNRHEVLRTRFRARHGVAEQVVEAPGELPMLGVDLSSLPPERREAALRRLAESEGRRPFDLERGPLLRLVLVRLDDEDHVVLATLHHIVTDLWSRGLFVGELSTLYSAFVAGEPSPLEELPIQYADFAAWQRRWLDEEGVLEEQLDYWKERLWGAPPVLDLPTDRQRPRLATSRGDAVPVALPPELGRRLGELARRRGATPFMMLLAGFNALLSRWSGSDDLVVGAPVAGRNRAETESLIGFFVNSLVLRTDLSGDPPFDTLLERVKETTLEALAHQDLPFERLVDELEPDRQLAHTPLFQVVFALQDRGALGEAGLPGLEVEPLVAGNPTSKFDLTLLLVDVDDGFEGSLEFNRDLFDATTVRRMADGLVRLLGGAVAEPGRPLSALRVLSAAERHQVAVEWPALRSVDAAASIPERFLAVATAVPDAVAVSSADRALTYGELERRSARLAAALRRHGAGPERRVGLCMERSTELVVALLAVLRSGAAYVPLDPDLPPARLAYVLEDCSASLLLADGDAELEPPAGMERLDPRRLAAAGDVTTPAPLPEVDPAGLAYVIYTSGSTGRPKGSPIEHRNVTRLLAACDELFDFGRDDVWTLFHSYAFDFSVWEIWGALLYGARLHVVPFWMSRSPEAFLELLRDEGVTVLNQTPSAFRQLVTAVVARRPPLSLRWVIFGGEALEPATLVPWFDVYGDTVPRLVNMYGITETTVHVTWHLLSAEGAGAGERSPVGRALPDLSIRLRGRHGEPVPIGVAGEILVGGAGLGRGYLGRSRLTAERFVPGGAGEGGRLYRSGDLARHRHDGSLEFLGRIDQQVKVRGFRIEPGEIEAVLSDHPEVSEAVVIADDDGGATRLVAYVVAPEEPPTVSELRRHLETVLPGYMVPALFVVLDALLLTAHGKLDRRGLPSPDAAVGAERDREHRPPEGEVEETLAEVWRRVLGVERIGRDDSFFELGGDSILSIQVVARAREAGIAITPRQIFEHRTVAALAAVAERAEESEAEQGPVTGEAPLTPIQHWFFEFDPMDRHHWNQSLLLALEEPLLPGVLAAALERLLRHHDALRARFERLGAGWRQRFAAPDGGPPPLTVVDLAALPGSHRRRAVEAAAQQGQESLDLGRGPLLRALLIDFGSGPERLFLAVHHLVVDGVSWRILLQDLYAAYASLARGAEPALPAKTTSYRRWAELLREHAASGGARRELEHWRRQAATAPALPADRPGGDDRVAAVRLASAALDGDETEELLRDVPRVYGTEIHEVLLAAVARAVAAWSGESSVRLDLEGHGREEIFEGVDLARTVGWFTTIHPLLLEVVDEDDGARLRRVKETLRAVPRRGIGYGLLRYLDPESAPFLESLPRSVLSFNYLGQVDRGVAGETPFRGAPESAGSSYSRRSRRPYALSVDGMVTGGRLRLNWSFGSEVFAAETVDGLARGTVGELRRLIEHCRQPEAGGFTPSDFPQAELDREELDELFAELAEEG